MDRRDALQRLPVAYAVALELDAAGVDRHTIADRLGVPAESVTGFLAVAAAKLATLQSTPA